MLLCLPRVLWNNVMLSVFTLAPNDNQQGVPFSPQRWAVSGGSGRLGSPRVAAGREAQSLPRARGRGGSLGLIPHTSSCTFPRAGYSLLVTGPGGGLGYRCPFLGAQSQHCQSLVPPIFPTFPCASSPTHGPVQSLWCWLVLVAGPCSG